MYFYNNIRSVLLWINAKLNSRNYKTVDCENQKLHGFPKSTLHSYKCIEMYQYDKCIEKQQKYKHRKPIRF